MKTPKYSQHSSELCSFWKEFKSNLPPQENILSVSITNEAFNRISLAPCCTSPLDILAVFPVGFEKIRGKLCFIDFQLKD